jgi:DNA ligase (NAD+)
MQNVQDLVSEINKANAAYYNTGKAIYTDEEYDRLKEQLRSIDSGHPLLEQVGCTPTARLKMAHSIPMGSLDNTEDGVTGVGKWLATIDKVDTNYTIFASLKIDGASLCANYKNGVLESVITRGNGTIGELITDNASKFANLPLKLDHDVTVSVRGEAILYKADFNAICDEESIPIEERSNPRNFGNGILGRDDGRNSDKMRFLAFNVVGIDSETEHEKFQLLQSWGFEVAPYQHCKSATDFSSYYNDIVLKRDELPFEIDGIVISVNEVIIQNKFITSDVKSKLRPKYARAVKFPHKANNTQLVGVSISVGHTGVIVPTAMVKTVRVGGVNVSNILLNNWDEIERLGIEIGDTVTVILSGDIIPKISNLVEKGQNRHPILQPQECPSCGGKTTRIYRGKLGANLYCTNDECRAKLIGKIDHWIGSSKKGIGIMGIGSTILSAIFDAGLVKDPADLYTLTVDQLEDIVLDGVRIGTSRATAIVNDIHSKKEIGLDTFLGALGIDLLGSRRAALLMQHAKGRLDSLDNWLDIGLLETIDLPGLGDSIRESIINGIEDSRALIDKLLSVGIKIKSSDTGKAAAANPVLSNSIAGKSFCFTGTRDHLTEVESLGGIIKSGVSKGLDYLVQANPLSVSTKSKKAEAYGTQIISVEYLAEMIREAYQAV